MKTPKGAIAWLVRRESCGLTPEEVRAKIEARCAKEKWATPARVAACGRYAAKVHAKNVQVYCAVVSGRIGRGR